MQQPDTNHQENKPLPHANSRSLPPPDPARDDDIAPPQQNIDQRVCINIDIDELEHLAVLPKQKDAIALTGKWQAVELSPKTEGHSVQDQLLLTMREVCDRSVLNSPNIAQ
jgi:hypothetical protein